MIDNDGAVCAWKDDGSGSDPHVVGTGLDAFNAYQYPVFTRDGTRLVFDRNNEIDTPPGSGT